MSPHPPHEIPPEELGLPGVESVAVDAAGRTVVVLNPIQSPQQWPGVSAFSRSFSGLAVSEKYYQQSLAFLDPAKVLSEAAGVSGAAGAPVTWPQGSVCYYCIHIAMELFLKACIMKRTGDTPKTHDVQKLITGYGELFPEQEFRFQVPLTWLQAAPSFETLVDRAPDQLYRCGVGKDGVASSLTHQFVPDILFNRVQQYLRVWPRAWGEACRRG